MPMPCMWPLLLSALMWEREPDDDFDDLDPDELDDERGATVFRVHDVAQNVDALQVAAATFSLDVGEGA